MQHGKLPAHFGNALAFVADLGLDQLLPAGLQGVGEPVQKIRPFLRVSAGPRPFSKRAVGFADGEIGGVRATTRDFAPFFAGGRINAGQGLSGPGQK